MAVFLNAASGASTRVELALSADSVKPGDTVTAAIRMRMKPGWHSYWRYPGDAGIATTVKWTLPPGVTAGPIQWPVPEKLVEKPLTGYVLENSFMLLVPLKIGADAAPGSLPISATVKWQECEQECLQGSTDVSAHLVVGTETKPSDDAEVIETARARLPVTDSGITATAHWEQEADSRPLVIEWTDTNNPADVDFFPYENDNYDVKGDTERLPSTDGKIRIRKMVEKSKDAWPEKISGLLVTRANHRENWRGQEVTLTLSSAVVAEAPLVPANGSLPLMLAFAFVGGLILNIMPCVLPVIALKVLGFVNQAKEKPARVRKMGLIYGAGVLTSFLVLAVVAIAVQKAGGLASWSSAFQNPQFRMVITILMTLVALNLFGVFEVTLSGRAMDVAGGLVSKNGAAGAFFNGVLAAVLATPCTAPFLAGAVAFAFTQPPMIIAVIFLMVGVGLATPFVVLCWQPAWLALLPKPGAWMERFKVAMGFPMLATAVWLFWVTATRLGKAGVFWLGLFLVILALAAWVWGEFVQRGTKRRVLAMAICFLFVASGYGFILENQLHWRSPIGTQKEAIDWQPWSAEAVAKARDEGHPVLVDFTADTCWNCQVNKATSIDIAKTREKLKDINAVTLIADFTDANAAIAKELKKYDRPGVPLVLVYPADKSLPPLVLPPVLTPGIVQDALDKAAKNTAAPTVSTTGR